MVATTMRQSPPVRRNVYVNPNRCKSDRDASFQTDTPVTTARSSAGARWLGDSSGGVRAAYVAALRDPAHVHAISEEYRAAATLDREHDEADRRMGRRITCPVLVLWSAHGPLNAWYANAGGPLALWRAWADDVQGHPLDAGHFFPEENPDETADALARFFAGTS